MIVRSAERCLIVTALLAGVPVFSEEDPGASRIARDLASAVPAVRRTAAGELARRGGEGAVDALIKALADTDPLVRAAAAHGLGRRGDDRAAAALARALDDEDRTVRYYAAHALGEIASPGSAEPLVAALTDTEWCVRNEAAWALREINDARVARLLADAVKKDDGPTMDRVAWILRRTDPARLRKLLTAILKDGGAAARAAAARRLGATGGDAAVDDLAAALEDDRPAVRTAAVAALVAVGDRRALAPLRERARVETDPQVKEAATAAVRLLSRHRDLVARWRFDAADGETAVDTGGKEINGRIRNCRRVAGKAGGALAFGPDSCVELGKPAAFPVAQRPFTVAAWVKTDKPDGVVIARGGAFCGFSLYVKDGVAKLGIHRTREGHTYIAAGKEPVTGRWVHLAGVVDSAAIRVFVDGTAAAETKTPGFLPGNCGQSMEIGFDIGNSAAEITDHFVGIIDEVTVFGAALSEKELKEFCNIE